MHQEPNMNMRQILVILTYFGMVFVNSLANILPINGISTGEISDSFPVLFTPAGYVFSIWGVIYLLLLGFSVYQALPAQKDSPRLESIRGWFIASNILNGAWIFLWHYGLFPLTLVVMLGLLVSLIVIYLRLEIGKRRASNKERIFEQLPFSVYLGWISVATIANFSITLFDQGFNGGGISPIFWTVFVLLVATGLGAAMIWLRRDIAYSLVLIWAFAGIVVRQADTQAVAFTAGITALVLVALLVASAFRPKLIRISGT
jgi:translocator protein